MTSNEIEQSKRKTPVKSTCLFVFLFCLVDLQFLFFFFLLLSHCSMTLLAHLHHGLISIRVENLPNSFWLHNYNISLNADSSQHPQAKINCTPISVSTLGKGTW